MSLCLGGEGFYRGERRERRGDGNGLTTKAPSHQGKERKSLCLCVLVVKGFASGEKLTSWGNVAILWTLDGGAGSRPPHLT